jgi:hypothetical protein
VDDAAATARRDVDRLLAERVLRQKSGQVTAEMALRDAHASALLEGAPALDVEVLRGRIETGADGLDGLPDDDGLAWQYRGALRVAAAVAELGPAWEHAPRQALARLHVLAARDAPGNPDSLGRPREDQPGTVARLDVLVEALSAPTTAPAVVVAAVVHAELLALNLFDVANGLVARGAARLVLWARGVDPKAVTGPDIGHLQSGAGYAEASAAYLTGDVGTWVRHCCTALSAGAQAGREACAAVAQR